MAVSVVSTSTMQQQYYWPSEGWQQETQFPERVQTEQPQSRRSDRRDIYRHPQDVSQIKLSFDEVHSADRPQGRTEFHPSEMQQSPKSLSCCDMVMLIFKRTVSILLIILDVVADWFQFLDMNGSETVEISTRLSSINIKVTCSSVVEIPHDIFLALTIGGSLYATFQIINIIGETIFEIKRGQKKEKKEKTWTGFRLAHGYKETAFGATLIQLPQILLLTIFSWSCYCVENSPERLTKLVASLVVGYLKDSWRISTCLHIPKPCCADCCKDCCKDCCCCCCCCCCDPKCHVDCCIVECDLCGSEACKPTFCWEGLCDGCCECGGCCECDSSCKMCQVPDEDPLRAKNLYSYVSTLQILLSLACAFGMMC